MQSTVDVAAANEAAVLARRREIEADRRARLTAKSYKIGVDPNALSSQIAEKDALKLDEAASDAAFDEMRLKVDKHLMYVDQQRDAYLRGRDKSVDEFRSTMQKKEGTREYDLNDPHMLRKDRPARLGDDDETLSASGAQKFAGEDLHYAERVRQQQAQLRAWNAQQIADKQARLAAERQTDAMWANHMLEADLMRCDYSDKESDIVRQRLTELAEYNLAQVQLKAAMRDEAHAQADLDNAAEIQAHLNSGFLGEDPALTRSFAAAHRMRPDHFKGFSAEQKAEVEAARRQQVEERTQAEEEEKQLAARMDDMTMHWNRIATLQESEVEQRRAAMRLQLAAENEAAAQTSKQTYSTLYKETYVNHIDDDFYKRFGTSAR